MHFPEISEELSAHLKRFRCLSEISYKNDSTFESLPMHSKKTKLDIEQSESE